MKKFLGFFFNPIVLWILVALCIGLVIWFAGPLLAFADWHPLESVTARIIFIVLLLILWLGKRAVSALRGKLANRRMVKALAAQNETPGPVPPSAIQAAQLEAVRARFTQALEVLRKTQASAKRGWFDRLFGGRRYVYQLPWYVIIGPPGSGKTTALLHSGLQFPLAEHLGNDPIQGVGGTRNCDWWFTNEAVLIDTAGRYVTQDSDAQADSREWGAFLAQLRKHRPRQPINGVLVTVSVSDLLQMTADEREAQSVAVRNRVQELMDTLENRFPVYVLITKSDLLAGFMEFFDDYDREQREQVWGTTFEYLEESPGIARADIDSRIDELLARLDGLRLDRLQSERDPARRAAIFGFVHQFAQIKPALGAFLTSAFPATDLARRPILRGFYLTSGTQEGNPIDRIMGSLARQFGLQRRLVPALRPSGKSYFLARALREVVFTEAPIAGTNLRWERRWSTLRWVVSGTAALLTTCAVVGWSLSFFNNGAYLDVVEKKALAVKKSLEGRVAASIPLKTLLPLYSMIRTLPVTDRVDPADPRWTYGWGLFQGRKLAEAADQTYHRLLQQTLAPVLGSRVATVLRNGAANPELQYETLKTYVMLREPGRLDAAAVRGWIAFDLEVNQASGFTPDERKELLGHVDAMLARNAFQDSIAVDGDLVARVRATLSGTAFPQRVYERLKREGVGKDFPDFRIVNVAGPAASSALARVSGRPLTEGVPGLYTYDSYYNGFVKALDDIVKDLAEEEVWVLGIKDSDNARRIQDAKGKEQIVTEVKRLYLLDYASTWERFVADITVKRGANLGETVSIIKTLSDPGSPLPLLLKAIVREVTLTESTGKNAVDKAVDKASNAVKGTKQKLEKLFGSQMPALTQVRGTQIESLVDDRFARLRASVRAPEGGGPAPIDKSLALIADLYQHMVGLNEAVKAGAPPPRNEVRDKLVADGERLPEPAKGIFAGLASAGTVLAIGAQRDTIGNQMVAVGELCHKLLDGRFPFTRESKNDVTPDDFSRVFAPGGLLDDYVVKVLAPSVDTTVKPWRFRDPAMGASPALMQFQRAAEIRSVFFGGGARGLQMRIELKPVEMDPAILNFNLDIDGQILKYAHGPTVPQAMQWPGPKGSNQIRLQISPAGPSGASGTLFSGPWALYRMFDSAQIEPGVPPSFRATLSVDDRRVVMEVTTSSVQNPFRLPDLQQFRCPDKL